MLKFVNISAYLGCYACLYLLLKAFKPLLLKVRALTISNHMWVVSGWVWIYIFYVIMNSSVACWWISKVGFSLCVCIVSKMLRSKSEVVLTMRKLLAERLCLNFLRGFLILNLINWLVWDLIFLTNPDAGVYEP